MGRDIYYNLEFRHPKKERLMEVHTYLTQIKPAICGMVERLRRLHFDEKWSDEEQLQFFGIKKWSEVMTLFGPYVEARYSQLETRDGGRSRMHLLTIEAEWEISGPDGELADLSARFPDVKIGGRFADDDGLGVVRGSERIYRMTQDQNWKNILMRDVRDPGMWQGQNAEIPLATREVMLAAERRLLDLKRLRRIVREGADVNAVYLDEPVLSWFYINPFETPEKLGKAIGLVLTAGWNYGTETKSLHESLVTIARKLGGSDKTRSVRRKMAAALLGRRPGKKEDAPQLFQESLKARDTRGLLASAFLGPRLDPKTVKVSRTERAWLKQQGLSEITQPTIE
jgi:hypothetical protein